MTTSYYDVAAGLGAAGFAGGLSVAIMNPLDTLKVRYQVATAPASSPATNITPAFFSNPTAFRSPSRTYG